MYYKTKQRILGFTLLETVITIAIFLVLVACLFGIYHAYTKINQKVSNILEVTQNGRIALDRMTRELRQTEDIVAKEQPENEIEFQDVHAPEIQYIKYYLEGDKLKRKVLYYYFPMEEETHVVWDAVDENGNSPQKKEVEDEIIAEYIASLSFYKSQEYGGKLVDINLTLQKQPGDEEINLRSLVLARNM